AAVVDAEPCGPDERCVAGMGCLPATCTPGERRCGPSNAWAECAGTGAAWLVQPCKAYEACTLKDAAPVCAFDCGDSLGCQRLRACDPLPPLGGESWVPPADATTL